jgi:4-aminobutyrate aminotransferase-like enzyme
VTISVGHCHPHVVEAARKQNELLQHSTTIYLHPNITAFGEALAAKMPGDLKVCYFVNSGSEANDLALLMARAYTGNYDMIALRNAYHGGNASGMGLTRIAPGSSMCRTASACITRSRRSLSRRLEQRRSRRGKKYAATFSS